MAVTTKPIVLITGANAGLGYETVKALLESKTTYHIILTARSIEKAQKAVEELKRDVRGTLSDLVPMTVDIGSDESIEKLYTDLKEAGYDHLDVLINNAGVQFDLQNKTNPTMSTREMWNQTYNINVTGTNILTETLVPLLLSSKNPRLLFMTSGQASLTATTNLASPMNKSPSPGWPKDLILSVPAYKCSKTGLNMMVREWVKWLREDGVKVFLVSPGLLATKLGGDIEGFKKMGALDPAIGGGFVKDVVEGLRDDDAGKAIVKSGIQDW